MTRQPDVAFDEVWKRIHDLEGKTVRLAVRGEIDIVKRRRPKDVARQHTAACRSNHSAGPLMR